MLINLRGRFQGRPHPLRRAQALKKRVNQACSQARHNELPG